MPKSKEQKELTVAKLKEWLADAKAVVFARYEKLPVKDIDAFRRLAREQGLKVAVAKKTLLRRAFKDLGIGVDPKELEGNFATVIGTTDEVAAAKLVATFAKEHEAMSIVGGVLENKAADRSLVISLAKLPSKQELLAKLVGSLNSPVSGLVNVLAGNLRGLLTVFKAIQEKKPA
ncbi:50S ribosomal protein L10 [Patescibacteria group bacterium]|nr:MAG: 50S ribosomal protein L10 [Patescibacteria group bacterium]